MVVYTSLPFHFAYLSLAIDLEDCSPEIYSTTYPPKATSKQSGYPHITLNEVTRTLQSTMN